MILAILLASATVTSMRGLRASMPASQGLARDPLRAATLVAELAPRISSRRVGSVHRDGLDVAPTGP